MNTQHTRTRAKAQSTYKPLRGCGYHFDVMNSGGREFYTVLCTLYFLQQSKVVKSPEDAENRKWVHIPTNRPKEAPEGGKTAIRTRYIDGDIVTFSREPHAVHHVDVIEHLKRSKWIDTRTVKSRSGRNQKEYCPLLMPYEFTDVKTIYSRLHLGEPFATIRDNLRRVTLPIAEAEKTPYLNFVFKHLENYTDIFFKIDGFSGRVHTPFTSLSRSLRPLLQIDRQITVSLDVQCMQPSLLGAILRYQLPNNEFTKWIDEGRDVYKALQNRANLATRDDAKKLFFEIAFGKPSTALTELFGNAEWVQWINAVKSREIAGKARQYNDKQYNNLAYLLQTLEVEVMTDVWTQLQREGIPFITVHDEIITTAPNAERVREIMKSVLIKEFTNPIICSK